MGRVHSSDDLNPTHVLISMSKSKSHVTRHTLAQKLAHLSLSHRAIPVSTVEETRQIVDLVLEEIIQGLADGREVRLSSFGTFKSITRQEFETTDFLGERIVVPERRSVKFRSFKALRTRLQ